MEEVTLVISRR